MDKNSSENVYDILIGSYSYSTYITTLRKQSKNEVFFNNDEEHAKIVLSELIQSAKEEILIMCSSMCTGINGDSYVDSMCKVLSDNKHIKVKILLTNLNDHNVEEAFKKTKIYELFSEHPNNVKIRKLNSKVKILNSDNQEYHFTIIDNKAFRIENNIERKSAYGNFNDPSEAKKLAKIFTQYFNNDEKSEPVNMGNQRETDGTAESANGKP